jgi:hypothetical protein
MMETGTLGLIVLALAIIFGLFLAMRSITHFVFNAIIGLLILFVANSVVGLGIGYSWLVILICGIGGSLGAILIIVLHFTGIAF